MLSQGQWGAQPDCVGLMEEGCWGEGSTCQPHWWPAFISASRSSDTPVLRNFSTSPQSLPSESWQPHCAAKEPTPPSPREPTHSSLAWETNVLATITTPSLVSQAYTTGDPVMASSRTRRPSRWERATWREGWQTQITRTCFLSSPLPCLVQDFWGPAQMPPPCPGLLRQFYATVIFIFPSLPASPANKLISILFLFGSGLQQEVYFHTSLYQYGISDQLPSCFTLLLFHGLCWLACQLRRS